MVGMGLIILYRLYLHEVDYNGSKKTTVEEMTFSILPPSLTAHSYQRADDKINRGRHIRLLGEMIANRPKDVDP